MLKCESSHRILIFLAGLCFESKLKTTGVAGLSVNNQIPSKQPHLPTLHLSFSFWVLLSIWKLLFHLLWGTPFRARILCFHQRRLQRGPALTSLLVKVLFEVANLPFGAYAQRRWNEKDHYAFLILPRGHAEATYFLQDDTRPQEAAPAAPVSVLRCTPCSHIHRGDQAPWIFQKSSLFKCSAHSYLCPDLGFENLVSPAICSSVSDIRSEDPVFNSERFEAIGSCVL